MYCDRVTNAYLDTCMHIQDLACFSSVEEIEVSCKFHKLKLINLPLYSVVQCRLYFRMILCFTINGDQNNNEPDYPVFCQYLMLCFRSII